MFVPVPRADTWVRPYGCNGKLAITEMPPFSGENGNLSTSATLLGFAHFPYEGNHLLGFAHFP